MTHEFKHPKYYTELRKRNKSDQAISPGSESSALPRRASGPGLKQQAIDETVPHNDIEEAASSKLKETSCPDDKIQDPQASSDKLQAPSRKHQASSRKRQAP